MALWDTMVAESTKSIKCPGCASNLIYDASICKNVCRSCGNIYQPGDSLELAGTAPIRDRGEADEHESNKIEYVCDGCGAVVVTDQNTAATFCSYCGSPTLIGRRLHQEFRPDVIIPFKITKEKAIELCNEWIETNKYRPNDLTKKINLQKITGLYVPFWLIDADCDTEITGEGRSHADNGYMSTYIDRNLKFHVSKVPFDGAKHIDNILMKALEPFDYDELVYYNDMYLPGFYAERYDESFFDITERAQMRIDAYAREIVRLLSVNEYDEVNFKSSDSFSYNYSQLYALLPVWFFRFEYEGFYYTFGVNGQTGEVGGSLPYSKKKQKARMGLEVLKWIPAVLALIVVGIISLVFDFPQLAMISFLGALSVFSVAVYKVKKAGFDAMNPIDSPPPVEHYVDFKSKVQMKKKDKLLGFISNKS